MGAKGGVFAFVVFAVIPTSHRAEGNLHFVFAVPAVVAQVLGCVAWHKLQPVCLRFRRVGLILAPSAQRAELRFVEPSQIAASGHGLRLLKNTCHSEEQTRRTLCVPPLCVVTSLPLPS